ncbi:Wzt carbohydrate-binding domain-containing protein, partial [Curtobacterium sp. MCBD17_008]|uniref:Wzt carbohydrate-binding domain-containing protein n=1 Tax=Curtobacterium sp. MCBD17_008 TaxID=2175656 RepID=UPI000DB7F038
LVVRATFSHTTVLPEWRAGIKIENHLGHPAFGIDSRHTGTIYPPMDGSATVEWRLKDLRLGGGQYFVHVFLAKTNGEHIVIQREAASFRVVDEDTQSGIAWTRATMRSLGSGLT